MGRDRVGEFERRERNLPHWEAPGETYAVRFSVRKRVPVDLTRADIAPNIIDALRFQDGKRYLLYDYTVMPDHVHAILKPMADEGRSERLAEVLGDAKKWMARRINAALGRRGSLWRDESFDRMIRNEPEYEEWSQYILDNPRVVGLIDDALDWPWWGRGSGT